MKSKTNFDSQYKNPEGWVNILYEGFEGSLDGSVWSLGNQVGSTPAYWGPADCKSHTGNRSAFCAKNGSSGVPCGENYPPNMEAVLRYTPFSTQNATEGTLTYRYWAEVEDNDYMQIYF